MVLCTHMHYPYTLSHTLPYKQCKQTHVCIQLAMCDQPLREVSNPGASGSLFYLSADDAFIIKTVQKKEARFLQKLLPGYYLVGESGGRERGGRGRMQKWVSEGGREGRERGGRKRDRWFRHVRTALFGEFTCYDLVGFVLCRAWRFVLITEPHTK